MTAPTSTPAQRLDACRACPNRKELGPLVKTSAAKPKAKKAAAKKPAAKKTTKNETKAALIAAVELARAYLAPVREAERARIAAAGAKLAGEHHSWDVRMGELSALLQAVRG